MTNSTASSPLELAAQYGRDVTTGKIITGELVKLAVARHNNDLLTGSQRGFVFCEDSATRALRMFEFLRHSKGELAGQVIELAPWQCWIIACVFGWKYEETGKRRFQTIYEEIARKNGKTTKLAGIGCLGLIKDDEGGPEIYAASTKREQSKILFDEAARMINQSPPLRRRLDVRKHEILSPTNFGKFVPLSSDGNTMDGLNPHFALVDELHAHKTSEVWDVLISALGARPQPLIWAITTAGFNKNGICYEVREYAIKVLKGIIEDDNFFAIIYALDEKDFEGENWKNPDNWIKANPNLGVSLSIDYLKKQAKQAEFMSTALVNFFTKHLNIWTTGASIWCNIEKWKACYAGFDQIDPDQVEEVYLGLDLASVSDIASVTGVAILKSGEWVAFGKHYLPEESVKNNLRKTPVPFTRWADDGWLTLTPGNITDYNWIKADIQQFIEQFNVKEIAFDRWNSSQLVNDLMEEDAPMIAFGQGFASMNSAMKELERRYLSGEIKHLNDPVLSWAMSNVVADQDPAGNIKPAKNKSSEKIDPAVALIMAVGRAMLADEEPETEAELIIL